MSHAHAELASDLEFANLMVRRAERREADRTGLPLNDARVRVASRLGLAPGTLENLRRGRLKKISSHAYRALVDLVDRELCREIASLEQERARLAAQARDADRAALGAVDAHLAAARAALGRAG